MPLDFFTQVILWRCGYLSSGGLNESGIHRWHLKSWAISPDANKSINCNKVFERQGYKKYGLGISLRIALKNICRSPGYTEIFW